MLTLTRAKWMLQFKLEIRLGIRLSFFLAFYFTLLNFRKLSKDKKPVLFPFNFIAIKKPTLCPFLLCTSVKLAGPTEKQILQG